MALPRAIVLDVILLDLLDVMVGLRKVHAFRAVRDGCVSLCRSEVAEGEGRERERTISKRDHVGDTAPGGRDP